MPKLVDRANQRYGRLLVLERVVDRHTPKGRALVYWLCRCDCGKELEVCAYSLQTGNTQSCGCMGKGRKDQHGHAKRRTSTYSTWKAMRKRCNNPNDSRYSRYGGRGIKVCERWASFENFLTDMGERPEETTLSRINHDKNYEPSNCEWVLGKH